METSSKSSSGAPHPLPFPRSYWASPGKLLAGCYPGSDIPAQAEEKLSGLLRCGVSSVVNLMEDGETDHTGRRFVPYQTRLETLVLDRSASMVIHRFPIVDMNIPTADVMRKILDAIDSDIKGGRIVYVHCWGGRGRTGTVVGCHLLRHRIVIEGGAIERLAALTEHQRENFWPTPQTREQQRFVSAWRHGQ